MNTMKTVEQAWAEFVKSGLPDVHELSVHQLERTREIFAAGWEARGAEVSGRGSLVSSLKTADERRETSDVRKQS